MTMVAPSLEEGISYLEDMVGIELVNGAKHVDMATHNRRIKLGVDCYLEVIAPDPQANAPAQARWFGLDQIEDVRAAWSQGRRLRGWVARTNQIDAVLATHGHLLGTKRWLDGHFYFSVPDEGKLPLGGVLPSIIDVQNAVPTAVSLDDQSIILDDFTIEHPSPDDVTFLYEEIGLENAPKVVFGKEFLYRATLRTPTRSVTIR
ncbi:VOC family protein [Salinarimonas ramus]|nr:VOC family protein [Salinarimonas ramus]